MINGKKYKIKSLYDNKKKGAAAQRKGFVQTRVCESLFICKE